MNRWSLHVSDLGATPRDDRSFPASREFDVTFRRESRRGGELLHIDDLNGILSIADFSRTAPNDTEWSPEQRKPSSDDHECGTHERHVLANNLIEII